MFEILVVINEMDFSVEVKRKYKIKKGKKRTIAILISEKSMFLNIVVAEMCVVLHF